MYNKLPTIGLVVIALVAILNSGLFIVPEGQQAIITQFGRPIGAPRTEAGLQFKLPFVQEVRLLDKRMLNWDGKPNQIPTKDKKYIYVDTTARWRIADPLLFIRTVQDERKALSRIDNIVESATRDVISGHNLVEAVRNTNSILDRVRRLEAERKTNPDKLNIEDDEVTGEIEAVSEGREKLSAKIVEKARGELKDFGISLIDVQLRRIAYEDSVEKKVYDRMISERRRIAEKIRSVGEGEKAKIRGKTSQDLQQIQSDAYRSVQEIRGKAEAEAINIYAEAIGQDHGFYRFLRTLEAYRGSLRADTNLIVSSDSEFLRLLKETQSAAGN